MTPIESTALVIVATIVLFTWNRLPVVVVAIGAALALWATGVVTLDQAFAGFGDRAVAVELGRTRRAGVAVAGHYPSSASRQTGQRPKIAR